ncbi:MAG: hypothetical protein NZ550_01450 [Fimbriimonadales bacterium]|nr:hypothetical protein [Fimbriimonadales bacterium]MDW8052103.1 hypothetical protein [Armatimonadota bacterium]
MKTERSKSEKQGQLRWHRRLADGWCSQEAGASVVLVCCDGT